MDLIINKMIELIIYFVGACICFYKTREFIAKGNAAFYNKGKVNTDKNSSLYRHLSIPKEIEDEIKNYHLIAAPLHKLLFGGIFLLLMIITRLLDIDWWLSFILASIITLSMSGTSSYKWQYWINIGNEKFIDYDTYEFTFKLFGKIYSWNIPRGFSGAKQRKIVSTVSWGVLIIVVIVFIVTNMYL